VSRKGERTIETGFPSCKPCRLASYRVVLEGEGEDGEVEVLWKIALFVRLWRKTELHYGRGNVSMAVLRGHLRGAADGCRSTDQTGLHPAAGGSIHALRLAVATETHRVLSISRLSLPVAGSLRQQRRRRRRLGSPRSLAEHFFADTLEAVQGAVSPRRWRETGLQAGCRAQGDRKRRLAMHLPTNQANIIRFPASSAFALAPAGFEAAVGAGRGLV
jgi:hypothetical protein